VHGQPIIVVGVDESLRGEAVYLDPVVKEGDFLRRQDMEGADAQPCDLKHSSAHAKYFGNFLKQFMNRKRIRLSLHDPADGATTKIPLGMAQPV
jgi:hypothetical protein